MPPSKSSVPVVERVLANCGVETSEGRVISVKVDRRKFGGCLARELAAEKLDYGSFADEVRLYLSKSPSRFDNALLTISSGVSHQDETIEDSVEVRLWPSRHSSVLGLLLAVPQIQREILSFMFDVLYERVLSEENPTSIIKRVVETLVWQDSLNDPKALLDRIFEMLDDFPVKEQQQLIRALPKIIHGESAHNQLAARLCRLYRKLRPNADGLDGAILEALTSLHVSEETIATVRSSVLKSIQCLNVGQLCSAFRFILQNFQNAEVPMLIDLLRSNEGLALAASRADVSSSSSQLLSRSGHEENSMVNTTSSNLELFVSKLCIQVMTNRFFGERWLHAIDAHQSGTPLPAIDFIFLITCYDELQPKHAQAVIKRAAAEGCLCDSVVATVLQNNCDLINRHFSCVLRICEILLTSKLANAHALAGYIQRLLFLNYEANVQTEVIALLLTHAGTGSDIDLKNTLDCVYTLCTQHPRETATYGFMLETLIEQVPRMSLRQCRLLFRGLAQLSYFEDEPANVRLRNSLQISSRKQLVSPSTTHKCIGVLILVALVEAMLLCSRAGGVSDTSFEKENTAPQCDLAAATPKTIDAEAKSCINLAIKNTRMFPVAAAFLCDQLSLVVPSLRNEFVRWLHELVKVEFHRSFVEDQFTLLLDKSGVAASDLEPSDARHQASSSKSSKHMTINIDKLCKIKNWSSHSATLPIEAMFSLFQLMRATETSCGSKKLQETNALLFAETVPDNLLDLDITAVSDQDHLVMTLFYTINWTRELINCASERMTSSTRCRLRELVVQQVKLLALANRWLGLVSSFVPPIVFLEDDICTKSKNFVGSAIPKTNRRGRKRRIDEDDNEAALQKAKTYAADMQAFQSALRSFAIPALLALLETENTVVLDISDLGTGLKFTEYAFLLEELLLQLDLVLGTKKSQMFATRKLRTTASLPPALEVVKRIVGLIPSFAVLLESLAEKAKDTRNKNTVNFGLENDELQCMRFLLSIFNSLLAWSGFDDPANFTVLRLVMNAIALRVGSTQFLTQSNPAKFHGRVFGYFADTAPYVSDLATAAVLLRLLLTVFHRAQSNVAENKIRLYQTAEMLLRKNWFNQKCDKSASKLSKLAQTMLDVYIQQGNSVERIIFLVQKVLPELAETPHSTVFPIVCRKTLTSCLKIVADYFSRYLKTLPICTTQLVTPDRYDEALDSWQHVAALLWEILDLVKLSAASADASCGLEVASTVLKVFLKHGITLIDNCFEAHTDKVLKLVKTLQQSTRKMQYTCWHLTNDTAKISLAQKVPLAKQLLETFRFQIQALFSKYNCEVAFQIGLLKMRDLRGEEIKETAPVDAASEGDSSNDSSDHNFDGSDSGEDRVERLSVGSSSAQESAEF